MTNELWGSDSTISTPSALRRDQPVLVDFGGFCFTSGGVAPNITEAEHEEWFTPPLAPKGVTSDG